MIKFWWTWGYVQPTPPVGGQSPTGSRYRWNSRVSEIYIQIFLGLISWSIVLPLR